MTDPTVEQRVTQTTIIPGAIKPRHLEQGLAAIKYGQSDERPTDGTIYPAFFALDTFVLSLWTGSQWKTVTLS